MALANCNAGKCEQVGRQHNKTCILAHRTGSTVLHTTYTDTCRLGGTDLLRTYLNVLPAA